MKFLVDQDVYAATTRLLRQLNHDVVTAGELQLYQAADEALLQLARTEKRVLVSRDRDYGNLVFFSDVASGVIYLRMQPGTTEAVHLELQRVLELYSEEQLLHSFCVIEPGRHRIRQIPISPLD